jgi:hypothetical protein
MVVTNNPLTHTANLEESALSNDVHRSLPRGICRILTEPYFVAKRYSIWSGGVRSYP